jgi:hypothetical protein
MPGLGNGGLVGAAAGRVHVTAFNSTTKRCEVRGWHSTVTAAVLGGGSSALKADVACHTAAGDPADSKFVLQFTK